MRPPYSSLVPVLIAACAIACGSSGGGDISSSSSGGSGSSSGGGPVNPSSPLIGTWDVLAGGAPATITIGVNSFTFQVKSFSTTAEVGRALPIISFTDGKQNGTLTTSYTAASVDLGNLPLSIGGKWTIDRDSAHCDFEAKADAHTLACASLRNPYRDVLEGEDPNNGSPLGSGTTTAVRTRTAASDFGNLGGTWDVKTPRASCTVVFEANRFDAQCKQVSRTGKEYTAAIALTFSTGLASGASSFGEISARRR
jgi:hypothetical protein